MAFEVGQRIGDYEVAKMLGVGGMGHVYLVRNIISNRTEAMKVLLPDLTAERDLAMRFISEIRTLAAFDHPNIAQLRTAFQANNQLIMIMEFVEGSTLEQLATGRSLAIPEVANYVSQALSALSYAHTHGVVHRDIKPANLMVTSHGIVKLMDFGIAKSTTEDLQQTRPGTTIGSLHYMSPEQVRGGTIDARSDLYSVGVVLYELTAGRRPFEADTTFSILNQQLNVAPTPPIEFNPNLPAGLNQIILTALAKDPADRYQTADEFRAALKAFRVAEAPALTTAMPTPMPVPVAIPAAGPLAQPVQAVPPPTAIPSIAAATAATQIMGGPATAPPPFSNVPPPAYSNMPPQAVPQMANVRSPNPGWANPQIPHATPIPPPGSTGRSGGHRGLWIAMGALVALIALVGLGFTLPHFASTFAGSRNAVADTSNLPQTATQDTSTPTQPATASDPAANTTVANNVQPANHSQPASNGSNMSSAAPYNSGNTPSRQQNAPSANTGSNRVPSSNQTMPTNVGTQPEPPANNAGALEAAEERLTQMQARANAAHHSISMIRSQNEASGYGLRGDIDSADSKLGSYLNSASNALARGDAAAAQRALDKAEPDLATVEKFLGH